MELLERVAAGGLLEPGRPVVVLLSGGRDSGCLLDVAVELSGAAAMQALHVNYGLREEADGDEAHCRALCERLDVELAVERADRPDGAPGNRQAWPRDVRYAAGARLAAAAGGDARVAAAHTATDQAETILYRLAASPGRRALLRMPARSGRLPPRPPRAARDARALGPARPPAAGRHPRGDGGMVSRARPRVARGRDERLARIRARARARRPCARAAGGPPRRRAQRRADRGAPARRGRGPRRRGRHRPRGTRPDRRRAPRGAASRARATRRAPARRERDGGAVRAGAGAPRRHPRARRGRARSRLRCPGGRRGRCPALRAHTAAPGTPHVDSRRMRDPAIGEILVQPDELKQRVRSLGDAVSAEYGDRDLLLIGVLKGAVFFLADLMRCISIPCEVDFMAVSSYGSATDSSGVVRILKDLDTPIEGRHVLIVEDIVDSGLTLQYLLRNLGARNPATLEVCALLTK